MKFKDSIKQYTYANAYGLSKTIVFYKEKDGKYPFVLWCNDNGEFCGSGEMAVEEINDYLEHFNINEKFVV